MEGVDYCQLVQKIIRQHAREQSEEYIETAEIVFDTERDRYLLLYVGWRDEDRMHGCPIHIDIKDGKIWIQRDFTEECLAHQLVELCLKPILFWDFVLLMFDNLQVLL